MCLTAPWLPSFYLRRCTAAVQKTPPVDFVVAVALGPPSSMTSVGTEEGAAGGGVGRGGRNAWAPGGLCFNVCDWKIESSHVVNWRYRPIKWMKLEAIKTSGLIESHTIQALVVTQYRSAFMAIPKKCPAACQSTKKAFCTLSCTFWNTGCPCATVGQGFPAGVVAGGCWVWRNSGSAGHCCHIKFDLPLLVLLFTTKIHVNICWTLTNSFTYTKTGQQQ